MERADASVGGARVGASARRLAGSLDELQQCSLCTTGRNVVRGREAGIGVIYREISNRVVGL